MEYDMKAFDVPPLLPRVSHSDIDGTCIAVCLSCIRHSIALSHWVFPPYSLPTRLKVGQICGDFKWYAL